MNRATRMVVGMVALVALILVPVSVSTAQPFSAERESAASESEPAVTRGLAAEEMAAATSGDLVGPYFDEMSVLPGFESGGLAEDSTDLEFYWHGELSAEAKDVIRRAEESGRTVRIVEVPYTYDEVWEYSLSLVTELEEAGVEVGGFGPNRARTAIEVLVPEVGMSAGVQRTVDTLAASLLPADLDVTFITDEGMGGVTFEFAGHTWPDS